MKNIELYRTIEALVQAKKQQYTPNKPSFAHEYCKQQIQKKKLIPFNPRSKMSRLMKNFHRLDTYVDVQQLFQFINMKIAEKQKEDDKVHPNIKWKSKQNIQFNQEEIIKKVREKLGPYNHRIFARQNQSMINLIQFLEQQSQVATTRKQNSPSSGDLDFFIKNTKNKQQRNKYSADKQKWRYFQGNNYDFGDQSQKMPAKSQLATDKDSLKQRQQKMELIHQVSTYLQIILQSHHKQKWGPKGKKIQHVQTVPLATAATNTPSQQLPMMGNEQLKKNVSFRTPRISTNHTQYKSSLNDRSHFSSQKSSPDNSVLAIKKLNSLNTSFNTRTPSGSQINRYIAKKVGVKENFTFRNRNIKQNLMKKIGAFLEFVQNQQKLFKKEKNRSINQLNNLQKKQKINSNNIMQKSDIVDDHQIKAVQNIVRMQK